MCLIIHREKGQSDIPLEFFEDVWTRNNDGWGIMWLRQGEPYGKKGLDFKDFWHLYRSLESADKEIMVHMRMKTDGAINIDMCHPFRVQDGVLMMHNGVIDYPGEVAYDKSDTWAFIQNLVIPYLKNARTKAANTLRSPTTQYIFDELCGSGSKLVFLDEDGFTFFNEDAWRKTQFGVNVSNTYAYSYGNPTKLSWYDNKYLDKPKYGSGSSSYSNTWNQGYNNGRTYAGNYGAYGSSYGNSYSSNPVRTPASDKASKSAKDSADTLAKVGTNTYVARKNIKSDDVEYLPSHFSQDYSYLGSFGDDPYDPYDREEIDQIIAYLGSESVETVRGHAEDMVYSTPELAIEVITELVS